MHPDSFFLVFSQLLKRLTYARPRDTWNFFKIH
uniref:Uncharacterized protein n=1 Tax=Rhizophora mucronata TaxID=61149 RepID=A0A2P2J4R9_RHIMU